MKTVVITGVSSGIGYAITKVLIANNVKVFGSVRTEEDAERISKDLGDLYVPMIFDITDEEKVKQAARVVHTQIEPKTLWGLVNNAGIAVVSPLLCLPLTDFRKQLEVNLVGHLIVTQAFAPLLGADTAFSGEPGKIINISSVAGKFSTPFLGAYAISKHGMEAMSDTLRMELKIFGIDVVTIGPGAIQSLIWEKGEKQSETEEMKKSIYQGPITIMKEYIFNTVAKHAVPAEMIGNLVLNILQSKKPKLRYAPVPQKFQNWILPNLLPKRVMEWLITKQFGLLKK